MGYGHHRVQHCQCSLTQYSIVGIIDLNHKELHIHLDLLGGCAEGDWQLNSSDHIDQIVVEPVQRSLLSNLHLVSL